MPVEDLAVFELRQYTLLPGRRDELIELFEREFVETQEDVGITVLGQFRDLDRPDRFVWFRGFGDMVARQRALTAFYDGPVWAAHRDQANATMLDSDNVRLLRPLVPGVALAPTPRPAPGTPDPVRLVVVTLWSLPAPPEQGETLIHDHLLPVLRRTAHPPLAVLATEPAANTFPRLPVRTDDNVVAVVCSYPDEAAYRRHAAQLRDAAPLSDLARITTTAPEVLRLAPTARSLLR